MLPLAEEIEERFGEKLQHAKIIPFSGRAAGV